jgi:cell division protein FtsB
MNRRRVEGDNKSRGTGKFLKLVVAALFVGISALLFVNSSRSIMTAYNRSLLLQQAHEEVAELRLKNLELLEEKTLVLDDSYVEKEARDRVFYTRDGEKIVILPETGDESVLGESNSEDTEEIDNGYGWQRWWNLLRNGV